MRGLTCLFAAALGALVSAQVTPRAGMPGRPPAGTPGPWDNDVDIYRVSASGQATKLATFGQMPRATSWSRYSPKVVHVMSYLMSP